MVQIKYPTKLRVVLDVILLINSQTVFKWSEVFMVKTFNEKNIFRQRYGNGNPLTLKTDQHLISPYNFTPESHIKVMRIKEMINN